MAQIDELQIKAVIEALLKGSGFKDAKEGIGGAGDEADRTNRKFKKLEVAGESLGKKLTTFLGAAALGAIAKQSLTAFASYERGLAAVGQTIRSFAGDVEGGTKRTDEFLQTLETTSGELRQDTIPTFNKFLGITKSVEGAMFATSLAADLSAQSYGDLKTNGERLANLLQGEVTEAAKSLGLTLRDANNRIKTQAELLDELIERTEGAAAAMDDSQSDIEAASAAWNSFKLAIGGILGRLVSIGKWFFGQGKLVLKAIPVLFAGISDTVGTALKEIVNVFSEFSIVDLFTGNIGTMASRISFAMRGAKAALAFEVKKVGSEIGLLWRQAEEQAEADLAAGRAAATKIAAAKAKEAADRQAAKEAEEAAKRAEKALELEAQFQETLLAAQIEAAEEGSRERLGLELDALQLRHDAALAEAEELGADTAAIETAFRLATLNKIAEFEEEAEEDRKERAAERLDFERAQEDALLEAKIGALKETDARALELRLEAIERDREIEIEAATKLGADLAKVDARFNAERLEAKARFEKAKDDLREQEKQNTIQQGEELTASSLATLGALFGQNKSLAIASSIINTFQGASKALAQGGIFGPVMAALIIAQGLAMVAKIKSTEPATGGSGFDDPVNDAEARIGGRRWARDMVRQISLGFSEGLEGSISSTIAASPSPTLDDVEGSRRTEAPRPLVIGTMIGDRRSLRRLQRMVGKAEVRDQGRRIR